MDRRLIYGLNKIVHYAKKNVPFYSRHYNNIEGKIKSLDDFKKVPWITDNMLARERIEDLITHTEELCETRYPPDRLKMNSQLIRMFGFEDAAREPPVLFTLINAPYLKKDIKKMSKAELEDNKIMVLADEHHNYFMGELGRTLCFLETRLSMLVTRDHNPKELLNEMELLQPSSVFIGSHKKIPARSFPDSVEFVVTINTPDIYKYDKKGFEHFDLFVNSMAGIVGIKDEKKQYYEYNPDYYYIESIENNQLLFTSFVKTLQPTIRYLSGDYGKVLGQDKFKVTYRGDS